MNVLVINVGSTTLKYACLNPHTGARLCDGLIDRIGQPGGDAPTHQQAAETALQQVQHLEYGMIGHRIVHGGALFQTATRVTAAALEKLKTLDTLAPLHNPPARSVVESLSQLDVPQLLVFDTAFFSTLSPAAYRYALPEEYLTEYGVRRYGAHGTSHHYVVDHAIEYLKQQGRPSPNDRLKIISLHLGGGASVTASVGGVAIDTSMGMTPLEGLVMATRCGDIDPAIPPYLMRQADLSASQVEQLMNKQSGLLGLCGDADMRTVLQRAQNHDAAAKLAVEIYVRKIVKTIGGYLAILGGLDAIVFTAGIGEHAPEIRRLICDPLAHFGIRVDQDRNQNCPETLSNIASPNTDATAILVIPTDEELAIARQVVSAR